MRNAVRTIAGLLLVSGLISQGTAAPDARPMVGTSNCASEHFDQVFTYYPDGKFVERLFSSRDGKPQLVTLRTGTYEQRGLEVLHRQIGSFVVSTPWEIPKAKLTFVGAVKATGPNTFSFQLRDFKVDGKLTSEEPHPLLKCEFAEGPSGPMATELRSAIDPRYFGEAGTGTAQAQAKPASRGSACTDRGSYEQVEAATLNVRATAVNVIRAAGGSPNPVCRSRAGVAARQIDQFDGQLDKAMSAPYWTVNRGIAISMLAQYCVRYQNSANMLNGC